jgi:hypothetical protein
MEDNQERTEVDRFIAERIYSVPHLEALLLLWRESSRAWTPETLAKRLWVTPAVSRNILNDLVRDQLLSANPDGDEYRYQPDPEKDCLLRSVDNIYRKEMIRISTLIHSNASSAVREFARAFRLKKERE